MTDNAKRSAKSRLSIVLRSRTLSKRYLISPGSRPDAGLDSDSFEMFSALLVGVWSVDKPIVSESLDE